jgi:hypothetical protein
MMYLAALILAVLAACGSSSTTPTATPTPTPDPSAAPAEAVYQSTEIPEAQRRCEKDADCVVITTNCCACSSGGEGAVVAAAHAEALKKACAADQMCPMMISEHPTCREDLAAGCVQGLCAMRKKP